MTSTSSMIWRLWASSRRRNWSTSWRTFSAAKTRSIRLGCLDIGSSDLKWWAPEVLKKYPGGFYEMHQRLFARAAESLDMEVIVDKFEPRESNYPSDESLYDGLVITGCANSANDNEPWLQELRSRLRRWADAKIRLSGFSFGPQILAVALGGSAAKNPHGPELSVVSVKLTDDFRQKFKHKRQSYLIHVHHNDHIITLPPGAKSIGSTPSTAIAGFWIEDHVLCFAGHPEYSMDPYVLDRLLEAEKRGHIIATQHVLAGQAINYKRTDWIWQTELQLNFFAGRYAQH